MDFEIIIQECFLVDPLPKLLNDSATSNKMAARAINRNKLLTTSSAKSVDRFWNKEGSLGLLKFLKMFCAIEQDGRQS